MPDADAENPAAFAPEHPHQHSSWALFTAFTQLALQGFGGVLAVAQHELCERRGWLTREDFLETLAVAQVLPGPNVCNLALMIGDRFYGLRGAFAALAGMVAVPLVIVLALTALYAHFATQAVIAGAVRGMGAVSAGLIAGTALKLAPALRSNPMGAIACAALGGLVFVAVALLHWPLVWVLLGFGALGWAHAWQRLRRTVQDGSAGDAR